MSVALQSGVSAEEWLADPAALLTAVELLEEQAREMERAARRRHG